MGIFKESSWNCDFNWTLNSNSYSYIWDRFRIGGFAAGYRFYKGNIAAFYIPEFGKVAVAYGDYSPKKVDIEIDREAERLLVCRLDKVADYGHRKEYYDEVVEFLAGLIREKAASSEANHEAANLRNFVLESR